MAVQAISLSATNQNSELNPVRMAILPRTRVLAWHNDVLYVSRGYSVLRARLRAHTANIKWKRVGQYRPTAWRSITSSSRLASRLFRDGFHALVALSSGHLVGAVPNAVVTLAPGEAEFNLSHKLLRGTRPLHLATTPADHVFWGEYFDNPHRDEVHIYVSTDRGGRWDVAYTFPKGAIRHVHHIVYDQWEELLLGAHRRPRLGVPHPSRFVRFQNCGCDSVWQPASSIGCAGSHLRRSLLFFRHAA
jgi:hypothetical protein